MGLFSYICPKCSKNIRYGEECVLRHIRHGKMLGMATGIYDGYGRVYGDSSYRCYNTSVNSHDEICKSEYGFPDSVGYSRRILNGQKIEWEKFCQLHGINLISSIGIPDEIYKEWAILDVYRPKPEDIASGSSVYHKYCYDRLDQEEKDKFVISKRDPEQGCGNARKMYIKK